MLNRETTFIIGAGASYDLGFPLGDTLRDKIMELLLLKEGNFAQFNDEALQYLIRKRAVQEGGISDSSGRMNAYLRAAATIRDGLPFARSIDGFLDGLRNEAEVVFLGKLAIATVIHRTEVTSPLSFKTVPAQNTEANAADRLSHLLASWHVQLGQILYDGHTRETLDQVFENATFIVFNYDRCIEEFLVISLMKRFGISREEGLALMSKCKIIHPYGAVGGVTPGRPDYVKFGEAEDADRLVEISQGIQTFTESTESATGARIKTAIAGAEVLVFMGFGWLPQNMELLRTPTSDAVARQIFATTKNIDDGELPIIADLLDEMLKRGSYFQPRYATQDEPTHAFIAERGDCKALMQNCWLRLTRQ